MPVIRRYEQSGHWKFVGVLNPRQMAAYYPNLDVLVLPSLNSTEAFGLVQIEAMMNNVPSIASNLPGVRQPVKMHNMGCIIPIGDSQQLTSDLIELLSHPENYRGNPAEIAERYRPETGQEFLESQMIQDAILMRLQQAGENLIKVRDLDPEAFEHRPES